MMSAIWWIRRDLRLDDNPALYEAIRSAEKVVPLFIIDPDLWNSKRAGHVRKAFILANLHSLDEDLRRIGGRLILREGSPVDSLSKIVAETRAETIFAQADVTPYARKRDNAVGRRLPLRLTEGLAAKPLQSVLKKDGNPYTVFGPYKRSWRAQASPGLLELLKRPERLDTPDGIESLSIPDSPSHTYEGLFPAGEKAALKRLHTFTTGEAAPITRYSADRNRPDLHGSSALSPYLRFGVLSARRAVSSAMQAIATIRDENRRDSAETWLIELIWREFYMDIMYHFPEVHSVSFRPELRNIEWSNDSHDFQAWCSGMTGYPIVDAGMVQLQKTGWMHNRTRMIAASFLVKDLLIDWRRGERWFMQKLIDGDPSSNNGGWQWTAGTGTDAAPYFRIFNPVLQGKKFDPEGSYIRNWLPALANVPQKFAHEPWKMSTEMQEEANCIIGRDYPAPIVDHAWARGRTLAAFKAARDGISADLVQT